MGTWAEAEGRLQGEGAASPTWGTSGLWRQVVRLLVPPSNHLRGLTRACDSLAAVNGNDFQEPDQEETCLNLGVTFPPPRLQPPQEMPRELIPPPCSSLPSHSPPPGLQDSLPGGTATPAPCTPPSPMSHAEARGCFQKMALLFCHPLAYPPSPVAPHCLHQDVLSPWQAQEPHPSPGLVPDSLPVAPSHPIKFLGFQAHCVWRLPTFHKEVLRLVTCFSSS